MADTYTTSLRLQQPTVGADSNTWGTILNTDWTLVDNAIAGLASVSLTGLTTYTLTANNGASDQARNAVYDFTGSLSAGCLVTLPAVSKLVWAIDATTGGQTVTLTTGLGGSTLTLPKSLWTFVYCDGYNVFSPVIASNGSQVAVASQFAASFSGTFGGSGYAYSASGALDQWGSFAITGGPVAITFPVAYSVAVENIQLTVNTGTASGAIYSPVVANSPAPTVNGFSVFNNSGQSLSVNWRSVGR